MGCSEETISRRLRAIGITPKVRRCDPAIDNEIVRRYLSAESICKIASDVGRTPSGVWYALARCGIQRLPISERRAAKTAEPGESGQITPAADATYVDPGPLESGENRPRVLLGDASAIVRSGLKSFLDQAGCDVVAEAACGAEVFDRAAALAPDVVVVDPSLPGFHGQHGLRRLRDANPAVAVIFFAAVSDGKAVLEAMGGGASGYFLKGQTGDEVIRGLSLAARGIKVYAAEVEESRADEAGLTPREAEVAALVGRGLSNKQIAERLRINEGTVKAHLSEAFHKTNLRGRTRLALWAMERERAMQQA